MNIHNELFKDGFTMNFEGLRRLDSRKRYIGCQYSPAIREALKFASGESGFGTLLALEENLLPEAVIQIYPAESADSNQWYVAMLVPKRDKVYGMRDPISSMELPQLMTQLRSSDAHKAHADGALFYIKDCPGWVDRNPHLTDVWMGFFAAEPIISFGRTATIQEFIGEDWHNGYLGGFVTTREVPRSSISSILNPTAERLKMLVPGVSEADCNQAWEDATNAYLKSGGIATQSTYDIRLGIAQRLLEQQRNPEYPKYTFDFGRQFVTRTTGFVNPDGFRWFTNTPDPAPPTKPEPLPKGRLIILEDPE